MKERELNTEEVKQVYAEITKLNLEPYDIVYEKKCSEYLYALNGKNYRLIYDRDGDWFCDIIYEQEV